jgi:hypothetical protein
LEFQSNEVNEIFAWRAYLSTNDDEEMKNVLSSNYFFLLFSAKNLPINADIKIFFY